MNLSKIQQRPKWSTWTAQVISLNRRTEWALKLFPSALNMLLTASLWAEHRTRSKTSRDRLTSTDEQKLQEKKLWLKLASEAISFAPLGFTAAARTAFSVPCTRTFGRRSACAPSPTSGPARRT